MLQARADSASYSLLSMSRPFQQQVRQLSDGSFQDTKCPGSLPLPPACHEPAASLPPFRCKALLTLRWRQLEIVNRCRLSMDAGTARSRHLDETLRLHLLWEVWGLWEVLEAVGGEGRTMASHSAALEMQATFTLDIGMQTKLDIAIPTKPLLFLPLEPRTPCSGSEGTWSEDTDVTSCAPTVQKTCTGTLFQCWRRRYGRSTRQVV